MPVPVDPFLVVANGEKTKYGSSRSDSSLPDRHGVGSRILLQRPRPLRKGAVRGVWTRMRQAMALVPLCFLPPLPSGKDGRPSDAHNYLSPIHKAARRARSQVYRFSLFLFPPKAANGGRGLGVHEHLGRA